MEINVAPFLLGTAITSLLLVAGYVAACWRADSRSTRSRKSPAELSTGTSDARFAKVEAEMAELFSTLEKLTTTVKRISSRQGMRDLRAKDDPPPVPPPGTSKAELRRFYGVNGLSGPEQAKMQLERERGE